MQCVTPASVDKLPYVRELRVESDVELPFPALQMGNDALSGSTNGAGRAASFGGTVRLCSALPDVPVLVAFQRLKLSLQID